MSPCKPVGLVTEFLKNPLCLETTEPRLSWRIEDTRNGACQTAYRIVAASSVDKLESGNYDSWDSGCVESDNTLDIVFRRGQDARAPRDFRGQDARAPRDFRGQDARAPRELRSRDCVFWRVMVWDKDGKPSPWSETARFEIGPFGKGDITASWIGSDTPRDKPDLPVPMFRKAFRLAAAPVKARLYVSALGIADFSLNGHPAGEDRFTPGWTDYRKRVPLVAWDVTPHLHEGENVIGAMLADGWYAGYLDYHGKRNHYGTRTALLAQLEVEMPDGSRETVVTDATWRYTEGGPVRSADFYRGEAFDARRTICGWDVPGFTARGWRRVALPPVADIAFCGRICEPIRPQAILPALRRTEPAPGRYVFDLGQNMVGVPRLSLRGKPGGTITARYAEMLDADGTAYTANYRSAKSIDTFTCRGAADGAPEVFEPRFTFRGFRYIELTGDFATPPECADVAGVVLHTSMAQTGSFECSDTIANRLWSNINWSQIGNFLDVPTDCPQRDERLGWTGDAQVFVRTAAFNRDVAAFFEKWQRDLADCQFPDGAFPDAAPDVLGGGGRCGYGDAGVVCPWTMYLMYGDKDILQHHYKSMAHWLDFWQGVCNAHGVVRYDGGIWHFGDWCAVDCPVDENGNPLCNMAPTPSDLLATAYYARCAGIMAEVARALGKKADERRFAALRRKVAAAYRREFVTAGGRVAGDTQTGYLVTLGFGLVDDPVTVARMMDRLAFLIESRDYSLTTGFLGTPLVCPVLTRFGRADLAYRLLQRREYPSWYFPIVDGDATTMWERWNGYSSKHGFGDVNMNSFNHYAYGAVGEWLYEIVGGIAPAEPGFRKIRFAPIPGGDIAWARTSLATRHGTASIEWRLAGGKKAGIEVTLVVPPNTTAVLELPGHAPRDLSSGRHSLRLH